MARTVFPQSTIVTLGVDSGEAPVTTPDVYILAGATWKSVTNQYVLVSGTWREVSTDSVLVSGTWRDIATV